MQYSDYLNGQNCIKVSGWTETGSLTTYIQETNVIIDVENGTYDDTKNVFMVQEKSNKIDVSFTDLSQTIKEIQYDIVDNYSNQIASGTLSYPNGMTISPLIMNVGINYLNFNIKLTGGTTCTKTFEIWNYSFENSEGLELDSSDDDKDGIPNYVEDVFGTSRNLADSDHDGLSDYDELINTFTEPLQADTDNDGISDWYEDNDNDGLNNGEEIKNSCNPNEKDSDNDGLIDGEELLNYNTEPLNSDTDGDSLLDGEEIKLGLNPLKRDTDGNGILDNEEIIEQSITEDILDDEAVSIDIRVTGDIENSVTIKNVAEEDVKTANVIGLIGAPVEVTCTQSFDEAEITFSYNDELIQNTSEENLGMIWYDSANDNYVLLDNVVVDTKANTVSYKTTHFSIYLLVDKNIWLDTWREDINYRQSGEVVNYDISLVVDISGSMRGNQIQLAKTALNSFVDSLVPGDRCSLVTFNDYSYLVQSLTSDFDILKSKISSLSADGGTNANSGLNRGISSLNSADDIGNEKMIFLICDGDINYNSTIVSSANASNIRIHCLNVINGTSSVMEQIAGETGGTYYIAATASDIASKVEELCGRTVSYVDTTDTDGDGLYDVYEVNGIRISNGQVVYSDPNNSDCDGDGISDYDELGGVPTTELTYLDGDLYSCTINHMKSDPLKKDSDNDGIIDKLDPEPNKHFGSVRTGTYYELASTLKIPYNSDIEVAKNVTLMDYNRIWQERKPTNTDYTDALYMLRVKTEAYAVLGLAGLVNIPLNFADFFVDKQININDGFKFLQYYLSKKGGIVRYDATRVVTEDENGIERYNQLTNDVLKVCEQAVCEGNTITFKPNNTAQNYFKVDFCAVSASTFNYWLAIKGGYMGLTGTCSYDGDTYSLNLDFCIQDYYDFYYENPDGGKDGIAMGLSNDAMAFLKLFGDAETYENCGVYRVNIQWKKGESLSAATQTPLEYIALNP